MRVRIHLNLATPDLAENVIKIQSPKGGWVSVAYADMVVLKAVEPVVNLALQEKVRLGHIKKVPHAFLEGDLVSFHGHLRDKAPQELTNLLVPYQRSKDHQALMQNAEQGALVGYNPRLAKCFYAHQSNRDDISKRFVKAEHVVAIGWAFFGHGVTWKPMGLNDWCDKHDLDKTSNFEKHAMQQGRTQTEHLIEHSFKFK